MIKQRIFNIQPHYYTPVHQLLTLQHVQGVLVLAGVQKEQEQGDGQAVAVVDIEEEENGIDED